MKAGLLSLALLVNPVFAQDFEALLNTAQACTVTIYLLPSTSASADGKADEEGAPLPRSNRPDDLRRWAEGNARRRQQMPSAASGLGLLWRDARHVLTTAAVDDPDARPVVEDRSGRRQWAERLGHDALSGTLLLRLPEPAKEGAPCAWGAAQDFRLGQEVVAVGHFAELRWTLQRGHVTALRRVMSDPSLVEHYIETSAGSGPGMAGGPLLDLQGRVVGMHEAVYGTSAMPQLVALALPIESMLASAEALLAGKPPVRAHLGLRLGDERPRTPEAFMAPQPGSLVETVSAGGAAAQAGVRVGDRLLALNGRPLNGGRAWARAMARLTPGQAATLRLRRDGKELELQARPEPAPPPL